MPDTPVTRAEFQQRCKAVDDRVEALAKMTNGEVHEIKEMIHDVQYKVDRNLESVQQMFTEHAKTTVSKASAVYLTLVTSLFVGTFSILLTLLVSHMVK